MKVKTDIRRRDLIHFNLSLLPRSRSTYVTIFAIALGIFGYVLWKYGIPETAYKWIVLLVASLGGGIGGMVAGVVISAVSILATSSKSNGVLGEHEYEITPEGLLEITDANEGLNKWSGIQEIREIGSFLLFRISGFLFHVIPRRSFRTVEEFNEFKEEARSLWRGAA